MPPPARRPTPTVSVPSLLQRRLPLRTDALRALRDVRVQASPPAEALARGKAQTAQLLAAIREPRLGRTPNLNRLSQWESRRSELATRLRQVLESHPRRSPEQVLAGVAALARRNHVDPREQGAAALVVRSARRTALDLLGGGPGARALIAAGIEVRPIRQGSGRTTAHLVRLPVSARDLGREIANVAWAVRKLTGFDVSPDRSELRLFRDGVVAGVAPARTDWHVTMTKADRAHALPPGSPAGKPQGEGSIVAHPDSGWAAHPQYNQARIDVARSFNTATGETGGTQARHATHRTVGSFTLTHGTGTGCLIVGGDGTGSVNIGLPGAQRVIDDDGPWTASGRIVGIAPRATVVPIKMLTDDLVEVDDDGVQGAGVVRLGDGDFAEAIRYAVSIGADVMSLSVGGFLSAEVTAAMQTAICDSDLIVVAAAGQTYNLANLLDPADSVIEPASFRDVIAVAGCSTNGERWAESHRGPNVDITAPCDAVWVADFDPDRRDATGNDLPVVLPASGTSFAAAIVAGAAAMWVAHWGGRAELKISYPDKPLAWVFRELLQRTAQRIPNQPWDAVHFGPGVLDVEALLREPLPPQDQIPEPPATVNNVLTQLEPGVALAQTLLNHLPQVRQGAAAVILVAGALGDAIDGFADLLSSGYAALEEFTGEAAERFGRVVAAGEDALRNTAEAAVDFAEEAAAAGGEVVDALVNAAEDLAEDGGEFLEDVVSWFS